MNSPTSGGLSDHLLSNVPVQEVGPSGKVVDEEANTDTQDLTKDPAPNSTHETKATTSSTVAPTTSAASMRSASGPLLEEKSTLSTPPTTLRSHSAPVEDNKITDPSSPTTLRQPSRVTRLFQSLRQATGLRQSSNVSSSTTERTSITHTETALCPICYCNEPLSEMYTVSEKCKHRFCKECLAGWITTLVVDGKVNALACPFDAAMISTEEKEELEQWACGTCTMKNPKLNSQCCACECPKDKWQCMACTMYNVRPLANQGPAARGLVNDLNGPGRSNVASPDHVAVTVHIGAESKHETAMEPISVVCSCCHTPARVFPPPVHPTIEGKCPVVMQLHDVQQLCPPDVVAKFERFTAMLSDPNNRDCPNPMGCDHRQIGRASSPKMVCELCQYVFCFEHSNAHPNHDCLWYEKKIRSEVVKTKQAVKAMGTRPCPYCKVDTLKNSGCNHMTCSQCHNEWCWLCNKGINGSVQWHFDPRNVMGCGGMQMSTNATTGCTAAAIRRVLHVVNFLIGGVLFVVVGLLAGITTLVVLCSCIPCLLLAGSRGSRMDGEDFQRMLLGFGCLFGFGPALGLFFIGLSLALACWAGLLPLFIGLSIREHCLGRSRKAILKMLFLPFVLHYEEWTMWRND